jgi:hypothetical protein
MENKRWYNITVFLKEEAIPGLLASALCPALLSIYKNSPHLHYFFYIDNSRGTCVTLFLEHFEKDEEIIMKLYHQLVLLMNAGTGVGKEAVSVSRNESAIFKDIPPGYICYGLFKLKTMPFTHFSTRERNGYFSVLKSVAAYLLSQPGTDLDCILKNNFLFCFGLIYDTCRKLIAKEAAFATHYQVAVDNEMSKICQAVNKPIKNGLLQLYEKNRNTLVQYTTSNSPNHVLSGLFAKAGFSRLTELVTNKIIKSIQGVSRPLFIQTLFADVCAILNLPNYITCLFFIQCQLNENFQHTVALNEDIIK